MNISTLSHLTPANRRLLEERLLPQDISKFDSPIPIFRLCRINLLLVTDRLSFSPTDDFGLGAFVKILLDTNIWAVVRITLANIGSWHPLHADPSLTAEGRIAARIENFRFDDPAHFDPAKFDAVFLFGITDNYSSSIRAGGTLDDSEIQVLNAFQDSGGGLFATGDHGKLGFALCSKVARARDMRYWDSFPNGSVADDEVSMGGPRRNDTNVFNAGSNLFNDQSDDMPQNITPRIYSRQRGIFRFRFPHPLLCGPKGVIRVMPDHPHEGECKLPDSLDETILVGGAARPEYPPATSGGTRPRPEIISWNQVAAGRVSTSFSNKQATVAHSFPGICAYDGHRAGVGRVVTDSTWHHFVNVNLIGIDGIESPAPFATGFLATPAGQAALEQIKAYFRNLMTWLSRPQTISCIRNRKLVTLVLKERVLEAVMTAHSISLERISPWTLMLIGGHARDALGRFAGQCESIQLIIELFEVEWREFIDPWIPLDPKLEERELAGERVEEIPFVDLTPMLDAALGGALVAISNELLDEDPKQLKRVRPEQVFDVARKGAAVALDKSRQSFERALSDSRALFSGRRERDER